MERSIESKPVPTPSAEDCLRFATRAIDEGDSERALELLTHANKMHWRDPELTARFYGLAAEINESQAAMHALRGSPVIDRVKAPFHRVMATRYRSVSDKLANYESQS